MPQKINTNDRERNGGEQENPLELPAVKRQK
jgi:hypothetical protein